MLIVFELGTGMMVRQMFGRRSHTFIFNRPALTLVVLTLPLMAWFPVFVRNGWTYGLALALLVGGTAAYSDSGAAGLGLLVACVVLPIAWLAPRFVGHAMAAAFIVFMGTAPVIGTVSDRLIPTSVHKLLADGHSRERVDVWLSFGAAIREQPLLGGGFGVSPRMRETAVAERVPTELRKTLAMGHPHNIALQIWTELGIVGAILALAIILLLIRTISRQSHIIMSTSLALVAVATAISLVGHGAWQGWWAASLGGAVTWILASSKARLETRP
jgi:O-antigen ligase